MSTADNIVKRPARPAIRTPRRGTRNPATGPSDRPAPSARPASSDIALGPDPSTLSGSRAVPPVPALDSTAGSSAATERRRDPLRIAARLSPLLGLAVSIGLVWWGWDAGVLRSLANLQAFIDSLGAWGPVALLVVSIASVVFPVVPGGLLVIAAPVLFGPVEGTVYNYLAVCTGSLLNFVIARHVGMGLIERMFSPKAVEKALGWTRSPHFTRVFATAIALPVAPDDLLCYLAGTTRMRFRTYLLIILTCKPWSLIAYGLGVSTVLVKFVPW